MWLLVKSVVLLSPSRILMSYCLYNTPSFFAVMHVAQTEFSWLSESIHVLCFIQVWCEAFTKCWMEVKLIIACQIIWFVFIILSQIHAGDIFVSPRGQVNVLKQKSFLFMCVLSFRWCRLLRWQGTRITLIHSMLAWTTDQNQILDPFRVRTTATWNRMRPRES